MALADKPTQSAQTNKFREAARELETGESEDRFAETVKRIGKAKPEELESKRQRKFR